MNGVQIYDFSGDSQALIAQVVEPLILAQIIKTLKIHPFYNKLTKYWRDRRGHDRMVVGFTTTCAISAWLSPLKS
jgi:dTDP-D-glucose 4,6-dehydratase